jgi:predicted carbohydrate-binding protein with CBM5 and CBM33 domain
MKEERPGVLMPRYQVIDPTGEGFFQVIDTSKRTGPTPRKIVDDNGIEIEIQVYGGKTIVVASFTPYCAAAEFEAAALADRLNQAQAPPAWPPPQPPVPWWKQKLRRLAEGL